MGAVLLDELGTITKQARDLVKEFEGKEMPSDKVAEFNRLHTRAMELKTQIEGANALEEKKRDIAAASDWLARPQPTVPQPTGPQHAGDGRKSLSDKGWEVKAGIWHIPTSRGLYPMYGDEALFGEVAKDATPTELEFVRTTRRAMQNDYKAAYGKYVRLCAKVRSESMAMALMEGFEQKALSEGTDTAGGILVPPDYQAEMLVRKGQLAVFRRAGARVQPTSRDLLRYPTIAAATATAGGASTPLTTSTSGDSIFAGGFVGSWVGETPAFTDTDPVFGVFQVPVKKIRAATKLSNDFISDSVVDIIAWLARNGAENMALVEDFGFFQGDGAALKPKGIVNSGATAVDLTGSTAHTISNATNNVGSAPKIISLWAALPPQYDLNARIVMSKQTDGAIRKLVDAQGRFLWPIFTGSQFAAPPQSLQGYPLEHTQFLADLSAATAAATGVVLGDFSNYVIAERAQITTVVLRERFADTDQVGIILFERVGGDCWNVDGFRLGSVT